MRCYTYRYFKLKKSCMEGAYIGADAQIVFSPAVSRHTLILPPLDAGERDAVWGRLYMETKLPGQSIVRVYAAAVNEPPNQTGGYLLDGGISFEQKIEYFKENGIGPVTNQEDMLLYSLRGRYLWLGFQLEQAEGGGIKKLQVINPGDHFLQTFPDVYQERNSLFHRYLSIFSTLYFDFEKETKKLSELFMPDRAPQWMLHYMGELIGIDLGQGLLDERAVRGFLKHAFRYVRMKGTGCVLKEITKLLIKEEPFLIEKEDGNAAFLLHHPLSEQEELMLLFFLKQFKPIYSKLSLMSYQEEEGIDRYCFSDINAKLLVLPEGSMDLEAASEQCIMQ